jgi:hypothetical protein
MAMKLHHITLMLSALCIACSSSFVIPDPVNREKDKLPTSGLWADGNDAGTYELILSKGYNYECPDNSGEHASAPFRHIRQSYDKFLKRYAFDFHLHILNDDDRGTPTITDRQRNEIKTDGHSPDSLVAQKGETLKITWKFCLPKGMKTTNKFSHVHQLKGIDNKEGTADVSMPAITFTCRSLSNGKQQFQVIYTAPTSTGSGKSYLARMDLAEILGEWLSVTEIVHFDNPGSYSVEIFRMRDGEQILKVDEVALDLWRDACTGMRPKWGLYRSFGENRSLASQLRDEILKFTDFDIIKIK